MDSQSATNRKGQIENSERPYARPVAQANTTNNLSEHKCANETTTEKTKNYTTRTNDNLQNITNRPHKPIHNNNLKLDEIYTRTDPRTQNRTQRIPQTHGAHKNTNMYCTKPNYKTATGTAIQTTNAKQNHATPATAKPQHKNAPATTTTKTHRNTKR